MHRPPHLLAGTRLLSRFVVALILCVPLVPRHAAAIGEQTGRIEGTVTDASSGARLPAVTVSARSPALIGGARAVLTDGDGRYELGDLPPGSYAIQISYPEMVAIVRQATVAPGATTRLNIAWSPETSGIESLQIVQSRPLTRPDSTQTGQALTAATLAKLPTKRTYQDAAQQVAGVSADPNPNQPNPNIKGGLSLHNHYLVDGLDITDPVTGTFSTNLSFDAIEAIDVLTAGMEAQYDTLGGIINVLTRSGGDQLHVDASLYLGSQKLSAKGNYGAGLFDGAQPFNATASGPNDSLQTSITAGGPIIKNRLWVNGTYELRLAQSSTVKGPPLGALGIQHPARSGVDHLARLKLTWAPADRHRVNVSGNFAPSIANNLIQGNSGLGVTETGMRQDSEFAIVSWDWFASRAVSTNVQAGLLRTHLETGPQGRLGSIDTAGCDQFDVSKNCTYDPNQPRHINANDGTVWYQGGPYQLNNRYRVQLDPSMTVRGRLFGHHDVKAGLQLQYAYRTRVVSQPGDFVYTDRTNPPQLLEAGLCDPSAPNPVGCFLREQDDAFTAHERGLGAGVYLQDRWWTPLSWLTVVPGLRFDWGRTTDRQGRVVSNLVGLGPRLGFVAALDREARATFFAYYGRHTETLSLLAGSNVDGVEAGTYEVRQWDPTMKAFTTVVDKGGGPGGILVDHAAKTPHVDEVSGGLRRALGDNAAIELDYTFRHYANLWAAVETNRIWDPTGARVVGFVDPTNPQAIYRFTTPDDNERTYHAFDLVAQGTLARGWDFGASYTLSWLFGPGLTVFSQNAANSQYDNPRQTRYYDGYLPGDIRHMLKLYGSYSFRSFSIGANIAYQTGSPLTKTYNEGGFSNYRSPLGTEPGAGNDPNAVSEFRTPDRMSTDVRAICNVLPGRFRQKLNLIADVFNAFNTRTPTTLETRDVPTFGQATSNRMAPFHVQLALQYLY
jgi:hypothetical protein